MKTSGGRNPRALNDQEEPRASNDAGPFHWWPNKGTGEWVEYAFEKPASVSETSVYWFDDTGSGECRVPSAWRVLYKDGEQWKPVENVEPYAVARDRYNRVKFKPVTTTALRLEVTLQPSWSAGIHEWKVNK